MNLSAENARADMSFSGLATNVNKIEFILQNQNRDVFSIYSKIR